MKYGYIQQYYTPLVTKRSLSPTRGMASQESRAKRYRASLHLHDAVRRYDLSRLKELVASGAPLTEIDSRGRTPMHLAVMAGSAYEAAHQMMTILLSSEDEDERAEALCYLEDGGFSAFHLAASSCSAQVMDLLLDSVDEEIVADVIEMRSHIKGELYSGGWGKKAADGQLVELDVEHMTLLHCALERLNPQEDEDDDDVEPPSDAEQTEAYAMVRLLIKRGADVNARDANARTPIHQAVQAGQQDMVALLLEAGVDPSVGCKAIGMENTVLHQAVLRNDHSMIRCLVCAAPELNVDAPGQNGLTPLCLAARSNKEACARALVEGGADPDLVTAFGKSALDIARTNNRIAILRLFGAKF